MVVDALGDGNDGGGHVHRLALGVQRRRRCQPTQSAQDKENVNAPEVQPAGSRRGEGFYLFCCCQPSQAIPGQTECRCSTGPACRQQEGRGVLFVLLLSAPAGHSKTNRMLMFQTSSLQAVGKSNLINCFTAPSFNLASTRTVPIMVPIMVHILATLDTNDRIGTKCAPLDKSHPRWHPTRTVPG